MTFSSNQVLVIQDGRGPVTRKQRSWYEETDVHAPLGTVHAEAFAMLQLKNNYFAWLLEAKEKFGDQLISDYDPACLHEGKMSAAQEYLKNLELNVQGGIEEDLVLVFVGEKYEELKMTTQGKLSRGAAILLVTMRLTLYVLFGRYRVLEESKRGSQGQCCLQENEDDIGQHDCCF